MKKKGHSVNPGILSFKDSTLRTNRSVKKIIIFSRSGWKTSRNPIFFKSKAFESYIHSIFKNAQTFYATPSGRGVRASNRFSIFQTWIRNCHFGVEKYRFAVNAKNGLLNYQKCFLIFKKIICCDFRIFFSEKNIFFGSEMWISLKIVFLIPKWSWEPQKWNFCKYDFSFPFHHSLQNLSHEWPLVLKLDRFCKNVVSSERRVFKEINAKLKKLYLRN